MESLIDTYQESLRKVQQSIRLEMRTSQDKEQLRILQGMERDLKYAIQWLEIGQEPTQNSVKKHSQRRKVVPIDPTHFGYRQDQSVFQETETNMNAGDRFYLNLVLQYLTEREREIYILICGAGYTYEEVAEFLGVSKSTIQQLMERAEKKIKKAVKRFQPSQNYVIQICHRKK